MSSESTIFNNDEILLPPKNNKKKTLVLDLDETLVHSQFMSFSDPSDVVIQIELENELHDIHVMVRPGVKEFLEKMSKIYEIVIFTASVSKYADPLLNIIDKKGYCPYRLFREHCSLINTTFVKDLQRLGRDIKNIIIVDNSPISYALHPENGLPILTWFEDKSDRELYKITTILQFLSTVSDVREFIPKFVDNNTINYEKANEIIKNYNGQKNIFKENRYSINSSKTSYDGKGINMQIVKSNNTKNNIIQNKDKKTYNNNKENNGNNRDKLVELAMKNIITSVSPVTVIPINNNNNNSLLRSQRNSKNKIVINNQKKGVVNEEQKNNKEKNYIKIDPKNRIMNIKNLSMTNNTQSTKKNIKNSRPIITDDNFKLNKHIRKYSLNENQLKNGLSKFSTSINKSITLNTNVNNNYSNFIKSKNITPKTNKTINLLNKSNHMTRSVKYSKKTNTYIVNSTPNNHINKLSKSLTKSTFNTKDNKLNKESKFSKYNNIYKTLNTNGNGNNYNGLVPNHRKQKSYNDFRAFEIKKFQFKNSVDKTDKYIKKNDLNKKSKIFFKQGINHHKYIHNKINNINTNSSSNIRYSNQTNFSNNTSDYMRSNKSNNLIKPVLTSSYLLRSNNNNTRNYSPSNRNYRKSMDLNSNTNKTQYIKLKNNNKNNNSIMNDKLIDYKNKNNQKKMINYNYDSNMKLEYKRLKLARPKSSNLSKFEIRINNSKTQFEKNGNKYLNFNKSDISTIFKKKEIYGNNK